MKYLIPMLNNLKLNISLIVIGPLSKNKDKILNLSKNLKKKPIIGENNILKYLKSSQIFAGSSGTSIYETAYSRIPSVLFQVANQQNSPFMLEKIGHYLNLNIHDFKKYSKVAKLIYLLTSNYKRFKKLNINPEIRIDNKGINRIIKSLPKISSKIKNKQYSLNENNFLKLMMINIK